jgi:hypothetical protein
MESRHPAGQLKGINTRHSAGRPAGSVCERPHTACALTTRQRMIKPVQRHYTAMPIDHEEPVASHAVVAVVIPMLAVRQVLDRKQMAQWLLLRNLGAGPPPPCDPPAIRFLDRSVRCGNVSEGQRARPNSRYEFKHVISTEHQMCPLPAVEISWAIRPPTAAVVQIPTTRALQNEISSLVSDVRSSMPMRGHSSGKGRWLSSGSCAVAAMLAG